jgi:hypothetical protein
MTNNDRDQPLMHQPTSLNSSEKGGLTDVRAIYKTFFGQKLFSDEKTFQLKDVSAEQSFGQNVGTE